MKNPYTRLTRSPVSFGVYRHLWLADDHIMQVESTGYSENYQRFRFEDIQGFFVTTSNWRIWWNIVWGLWVIVAGLAFAGALSNYETPVVSAVFLIIGLTFLCWNSLLGRTCRVFIVTKVQTVQLGSIGRRRTFNRVMARIQPLITAAQASLVNNEQEFARAAETPPSIPAPPPLSST